MCVWGFPGASQPYGCVNLCIPHASLHFQVLTLLWKTKRLGAFLTSEVRVFHNAGVIAEKALFLDPTSWNSLTDRSVAYLPCLNGHNGLVWRDEASSVRNFALYHVGLYRWKPTPWIYLSQVLGKVLIVDKIANYGKCISSHNHNIITIHSILRTLMYFYMCIFY